MICWPYFQSANIIWTGQENDHSVITSPYQLDQKDAFCLIGMKLELSLRYILFISDYNSRTCLQFVCRHYKLSKWSIGDDIGSKDSISGQASLIMNVLSSLKLFIINKKMLLARENSCTNFEQSIFVPLLYVPYLLLPDWSLVFGRIYLYLNTSPNLSSTIYF